jgi:murein DD-endopeptidase MepM/ murein hydrolase activator NlpD
VEDFNLDDFTLGTKKRGVKLTSEMGLRAKPTSTASTNHPGIDLAAPAGTAVYAPLAGTVDEVLNQGTKDYGIFIVIKHDNNIYTRFGHLLEMPSLAKHTTVNPGQQIGKVGSTGDSTGPHLHFEVIEKVVKGSKTTRVKLNPIKWLEANPDATFPVAVTD